MKTDEELTVLISAYACSPRLGSEPGVGWNWLTHLAQHCQVVAITEAQFEHEVRETVAALGLRSRLTVHFIDIGDKARKRCWNQGDWRFYKSYRAWQLRAYEHAKALVEDQKIDLCHHLNMIGYREPGYLWRLNRPFVWGPVGGHENMPWRFLSVLGMRDAVYHVCRTVANTIQMRFSHRVHCCAARAAQIVASTVGDQLAIQHFYGRQSTVIPETAVPDISARAERKSAGTLNVVWCGRLIGSKALPIALRAVAAVCRDVPVHLTIIGGGPEEARCKYLAGKLGIASICEWCGQLGHRDALSIMQGSDVFLLTSLQEATSTVVMEALACGLPVLCHDTCGFGSIIDDTCGIKVRAETPRASVQAFAHAIELLYRDIDYRHRLSSGACVRAEECTWTERAKRMLMIYRAALEADAPARTESPA